MRLFRGLSTFRGDKPGGPGGAAPVRPGGCAGGADLGVYCPPPARPWRQRVFCGCPQAVLSLIHISRGQPGAAFLRVGPFLTTPRRSLMRKGKADLPSFCPHACPQNAGTNAQARRGDAATTGKPPVCAHGRWISAPKIIHWMDCAFFDRRVQVLVAMGFFATAPWLSSSFSTVAGDMWAPTRRAARLLPPEGAARPSGGRAAGRLFLRRVGAFVGAGIGVLMVRASRVKKKALRLEPEGLIARR